MFTRSKLRGTYGRIYPVAVLSTYMLGIIEFMIRNNLRDEGMDIPRAPLYSACLLAVFFIVMGFIQLCRYKLWTNLILGILMGTGSFLSMAHYVFPFIGMEVYVCSILAVILYIIIQWRVLYSHEKFEANARRLFKLAAELIDEQSDGFTERPYSAGQVEADRDELLGFARFLNGKLVARSYYMDHNIYLAFSMNKSLLKVNHPSEVSYVAINDAGELTVRISEEDYRRYRTTLSFDQVCASLAKVFIRFLDYYCVGNEMRILTELKTAR